jgi:hypothetical protein
VVGTYPPYTDPTYWNEGLKPSFRLKPQLEVFRSTLTAEANLLLRKRPELVLCTDPWSVRRTSVGSRSAGVVASYRLACCWYGTLPAGLGEMTVTLVALFSYCSWFC